LKITLSLDQLKKQDKLQQRKNMGPNTKDSDCDFVFNFENFLNTSHNYETGSGLCTIKRALIFMHYKQSRHKIRTLTVIGEKNCITEPNSFPSIDFINF